MDLDLATDLKFLKPLIEAITIGVFEFATGSRLMSDSKVERTLRRSISSKSYNFLVRHMLHSKLKDHQCGFKAFKREPTLQILDEVKATALVLGHRNLSSSTTKRLQDKGNSRRMDKRKENKSKLVQRQLQHGQASVLALVAAKKRISRFLAEN